MWLASSQFFGLIFARISPAFKIMNCQKQEGGTDCGLFAIANAVEVVAGKNPENVIFDQTAMRQHLKSCFEIGKLEPFPKYRVQLDESSKSKPKISPESDWVIPRRSSRIRTSQQNNSKNNNEISLYNRFVPAKAPDTPANTTEIAEAKKQPLNPPKNGCKSDIVYNISKASLSLVEQDVLEKGFNFCPSLKSPDKPRLLDDLYRFCRKLKLKEHFYDPKSTKSTPEDVEPSEQCEINMKVSNKYYNPSKDPSDALKTYISAVKNDIAGMMNKRIQQNVSRKVHQRGVTDNTR
jgi:hypothetical protein